MAANEIHIGDIGTVFELTMMDGDVVVDISGATAMEIIFLKPTAGQGTKVVKSMPEVTLTSGGTDGKMQYVTVADDLDTEGKWKIQGKVTLPTGTWSSDISSFKVHANL